MCFWYTNYNFRSLGDWGLVIHRWEGIFNTFSNDALHDSVVLNCNHITEEINWSCLTSAHQVGQKNRNGKTTAFFFFLHSFLLVFVQNSVAVLAQYAF